MDELTFNEESSELSWDKKEVSSDKEAALLEPQQPAQTRTVSLRSDDVPLLIATDFLDDIIFDEESSTVSSDNAVAPPDDEAALPEPIRCRRGRPRSGRGRHRVQRCQKQVKRRRVAKAVRYATTDCSRPQAVRCLSQYYRAHREEQLERIAERRKIRYEENKEEENARRRARYVLHRDETLKYQRYYNAEHTEEYKEYFAQYYWPVISNFPLTLSTANFWKTGKRLKKSVYLKHSVLGSYRIKKY